MTDRERIARLIFGEDNNQIAWDDSEPVTEHCLKIADQILALLSPACEICHANPVMQKDGKTYNMCAECWGKRTTPAEKPPVLTEDTDWTMDILERTFGHTIPLQAFEAVIMARNKQQELDAARILEAQQMERGKYEKRITELQDTCRQATRLANEAQQQTAREIINILNSHFTIQCCIGEIKAKYGIQPSAPSGE